ncbi:LPXTG cell wall anchor domain-containing protein [Nitrogeniibacter aestuarii]|uniref:LPXTG cell wall anchor domain-containing protein n=1 Tax=Nitrogeniibacter aestuarii TaxID=2815343 RepID=UPI001D11B249|nr:LPXTG cell wall anchor domain-containing protein [Nitrogeniibacter aestuarii]
MGFISKLRSALLPPILILFGIGLGVGAVDEMNTSKALADHGVATKALVEEITWKKKTGVEKSFKAKVVFQLEDGTVQRDTINVGTDLGKRLRDDESITHIDIKYLPENPAKAELANHTDQSTWMFGASAALTLVGVGILVFRRRKKQAALAAA